MKTKQPRPEFDTNIVTPEFRISYPHLFKATRNTIAKNGEGRDQFDLVMMFDKTNKVALQPMYDMMKKVAEFRFGPNPKGLKNPIKDGDTAASQSGELLKEKNPMYVGHMILNSWTTNRPGVVNKSNQPILDSDEIYGGCFCRAVLNCYAYETAGNRGIAFGLVHVQKIKDGDPFGNRVKPEDAFAPLAGEESMAEETSDSGMFN